MVSIFSTYYFVLCRFLYEQIGLDRNVRCQRPFEAQLHNFLLIVCFSRAQPLSNPICVFITACICYLLLSGLFITILIDFEKKIVNYFSFCLSHHLKNRIFETEAHGNPKILPSSEDICV